MVTTVPVTDEMRGRWQVETTALGIATAETNRVVTKSNIKVPFDVVYRQLQLGPT